MLLSAGYAGQKLGRSRLCIGFTVHQANRKTRVDGLMHHTERLVVRVRDWFALLGSERRLVDLCSVSVNGCSTVV